MGGFVQNSLEPEGGMLQQRLRELQLFAVIADARLELECVLLNQFECFFAGNRIAGTKLRAGNVRHAS
jgi:hypothetical protein